MNPMPADVKLKCASCARPFRWSGEAQVAYAAAGWSAPKHCRACRAFPKSQRVCRSCGKVFVLTSGVLAADWNFCPEHRR